MVAMCKRRSGADVDAEEGYGDGTERIAVEGLGFVVVNHICCGHLERFAPELPRQAAKLLGEVEVGYHAPAGDASFHENRLECSRDCGRERRTLLLPGNLFFDRAACAERGPASLERVFVGRAPPARRLSGTATVFLGGKRWQSPLGHGIALLLEPQEAIAEKSLKQCLVQPEVHPLASGTGSGVQGFTGSGSTGTPEPPPPEPRPERVQGFKGSGGRAGREGPGVALDSVEDCLRPGGKR